MAAPADRAKAISLVLAGGVVGGFLGPESARRAMDLFATPFLGGFVVLAGYALVALAVQSRVHVPPPTLEERSGGGRPLAAIMRQPVFIVAALSGGDRLRPHEPADDGHADRDELLQPPVRRGGAW